MMVRGTNPENIPYLIAEYLARCASALERIADCIEEQNK